MNGLPGKNAEAGRNISALVVLQDLKEKLCIVLGENGVFAFVKEPLDFGLKIKDILAGPF